MTAVDQYPLSPEALRKAHPTVIVHSGGTRYPDHPDPIYPYTPSQSPEYEHCATCWRYSRDMALITDPNGRGVIWCCRSCRRDVPAGRPVTLPTGHALVEVWERLARLHHNRNIGDDHLDAALAGLAPHLSLEAGRDTVAALQDAMLRLQAADDPSTVLDGELIGIEHDGETYVAHVQGLAEDAMAKLVEAARAGGA